MPFIARYKSTDPHRMLLGGWAKGESSRFESRKDAEARLRGVIEIHANLDTPLVVTGVVAEVPGPIEIFDDGSYVGSSWGKGSKG